MHLDVDTLMIGDSLVAMASAVLLLVVWIQDRALVPPLLWAAGNLCLSVGIALLAYFPPPPSEFVRIASTAMFCAGDSFVLAGALRFASRPPCPPGMLIGIAAALALCALANAGVLPILATAVSEAIPGLFVGWAAYVFWSGRVEPLKARVPLVAFMAVHAIVIEMIVPASFQASVSMQQPSVTSLFGLIHFETIIYVMATSVLLTSLVRERQEVLERSKALRDFLIPGLFNRRGFVAEAERTLTKSFSQGAPVSILLFDLDHFKRVNDTFGHQMGDEVLVTFGNVLRRSLRPTDVLGRMGGEEFVALLPGASIGCAVALAERTRSAYAEAARYVGGQLVKSTVTIGAMTAEDAAQLSDMLDAADVALYEAKALGRDRVQAHASCLDAASNIVRVA